jgi:hypothetical protein
MKGFPNLAVFWGPKCRSDYFSGLPLLIESFSLHNTWIHGAGPRRAWSRSQIGDAIRKLVLRRELSKR